LCANSDSRRGDHLGDPDLGVVGQRGGEGALAVRLGAVVELLDHAVLQLVEQRAHVGAGYHHLQQLGEPLQGAQIGHQCLVGAGILDLDGHLAAVVPDRVVHLPDARGGGLVGVELGEPLAPVPTELLGQHPVHVLGRHLRRVGLQLDQGFLVRLGQLVGDHRLVHRERLAELHRAALELAEHGEDLVGVAHGQLGGDLLAVPAGDSPGPASGGPAGKADRQRSQTGGALEGSLRRIGHRANVTYRK